MKTLDEVINIFEKACDLEQRCKDCSGCLAHDEGCPNDGANTVPDALHYLKMYRSDMQMYADNQKYWEDELKQMIKDFGAAKDRYIKRLKELDIGTLNDPLTWDEIKTMEGKPVWVECWLGKRWGLVYRIDKTDNNEIAYCMISVGHSWSLYAEDIGKIWQAYRKERK